MKTRIAVFSRTKNFWGGSFQYAKAFTEALTGLDPEQFEIQVWHEDDEDWNTLCSRLGFTEHILGSYNFPTTFLPEAKRILSELRTIKEDDAGRAALLASLHPFSADAKMDSYHPHLVVSPQMGCPRYQQGAKHIGVIHDLMHRYETRFPEVGSPAEINAREKLFQGIVSHCDVILVDSKVGFRHVKECYRQVRDEQIQILPFTAFNEITQTPSRKPDFTLPEKFIFYPAQFWMHKNHTTLAKSIAILKNELPDIAIVAAGNTEQNGYVPFLDIITKEHLNEHFILPGYISADKISWLYRHARALVMPTFFGPTNIPPLEAMALGCPVAISGIYGMPEQCGNAALYFKPDDPVELANVLRRLWTDNALCADLKTKGLARSKMYDVSKFNKQVLRIIKNIYPYTSSSTNKPFNNLTEIPRRLRVMQVDGFYPSYLNSFYRTRPGLTLKGSMSQTDAILKDGFSAIHAIVPYLPAEKYETEYFVYQAFPLQRAWAREQNLAFPAQSPDWQGEMIRRRVESFRPDVLYMADPVRFDGRFLATLPFRPRLVLGWKGADVPFNADFHGYDVILSGLPKLLRFAETRGAGRGVMFRPGVPRWLADAVADTPKTVDVCFVGSVFPFQHTRRITMLDALARAAVEHGFTLALHLNCDPRIVTPAMRPWLRPPVFGLAMMQAFAASRIVVDDRARHGVIMPDGSKKIDLGGEDTINMRMFEATGSGALLLTEALPGVRRYFEPGKEVAVWKDVPELVARTLHYLAHESECSAVAEAGRRRCLAEHSMDDTVKRFMKIVHDNLPG